ncbi:uncharacterized protein BO97DRAFT_380866 [Aspergillus homomorphus CBS 101889]|uniref:HD domain-containing protein n=1 Tax=Aspergillus homomorphus (strain CBS 101889) TaxID=1450537 RepID=A0A395IBU3_ASPHC|nr:hypothetical protein BO97DRAFT_380866 [Aspergillus homomorphus CBS 101889]RAL17465.1 hypothetical protein BO97DRAFT_380866 [Aspergillus homomorphus CBS 101889]
MPPPTRLILDIEVSDTPLIRKAHAYAQTTYDPFTYNHIMRSWLFGTLLITQRLTPSQQQTFDHEAFAIATLLHDLGWALDNPRTTPLISTDKRFEVDGANAARAFLAREAPDWAPVRVQLVWDAIALHTTGSIAAHKEPEVALTAAGIRVDFWGRGDFATGRGVTWEVYTRIATEFSRAGFVDGVKEIMCQLCRQKPQTTFDNFVRDFGEKYLREEGFTLEGNRGVDRVEGAVVFP